MVVLVVEHKLSSACRSTVVNFVSKVIRYRFGNVVWTRICANVFSCGVVRVNWALFDTLAFEIEPVVIRVLCFVFRGWHCDSGFIAAIDTLVVDEIGR